MTQKPRGVEKTATAFTLFSQLPTELRLKIWHHAIPLFPRVLELKPVRWNDTTFPETLPRDFRTAAKWTLSPSSIPALLSVNSEARFELLPFYSFRFKEIGVAASSQCPNPWEVPFCPETDMLHVNVRKSQKVYDGTRALFEEVFGKRSKEVVAKLAKLAGSERFWGCLREEGMSGVLGELSGLEEAVLVVPSRTMRVMKEMNDCCDGDAELASLEEKISIWRERDQSARKFEMRMCAAGDLSKQREKHQLECDFLSSGTDIYVFT